jgi:superfamily I DNA/RNA helicase
VTVATYHASKGLEWPFMVLTELDAESKATAFGARVASEKAWEEVDWRSPLDGTVKANKYRPFSASNPAERVHDS